MRDEDAHLRIISCTSVDRPKESTIDIIVRNEDFQKYETFRKEVHLSLLLSI